MKEQFKISDRRLVNVLIRMYELYEEKSDSDTYCAYSDVIVRFRRRSLCDLSQLYTDLQAQVNEHLVKQEGLGSECFSRRGVIEEEMKAFEKYAALDGALADAEVVGDYISREIAYLNPLLTVLFFDIDYHRFKKTFIVELQALIDRLVAIDSRFYTHRFRKVLDAFLYSLDKIVNDSYEEEYDLLFDLFSDENHWTPKKQRGLKKSTLFFKEIHRLNVLRPHIDMLRESLAKVGETEFRQLLRKLVEAEYAKIRGVQALFCTFSYVAFEQFHKELYLEAMRIFNADESHSYRIRKKEARILYEHEFFDECGSNLSCNYPFMQEIVRDCVCSYLAIKDLARDSHDDLVILENEDPEMFRRIIIRETLSGLLLTNRLIVVADHHGVNSLHNCARHFYFLYKEYILQDAAHPDNCNGFTEIVNLNSVSGAFGDLLSQVCHSKDEFYIILLVAFARGHVEYPRRPRIQRNIARGFALRTEGNIFAISFFKSILSDIRDS